MKISTWPKPFRYFRDIRTFVISLSIAVTAILGVIFLLRYHAVNGLLVQSVKLQAESYANLIVVAVDYKTLGYGQPDLWVIDLDDPAHPHRITYTDWGEGDADWSPDDSRFVIHSRDWASTKGKPAHATGLYAMFADGSGEESLLCEGGESPAWRR